MGIGNRLMALVKNDCTQRELTETLQLFRSDHKAGLMRLASDVKTSVTSALAELLDAEMSRFLQSAGSGNKRNGFHPLREYVIKGVGAIQVRVPKDRLGAFKSAVVPKHQRMDPRLREDMAILHLSGLSTRTLSMISRRLLGIAVNKDAVTASLDTIKDEAERWLERPLTDKYWGLYIDGTYFSIQRAGTTQKEPSLVVLGIDSGNHLSVLAVVPGSKDSAAVWRTVFQDLKTRGLQSEAVKIGVMDGLPGLENAFRDAFENAVTGRCWRHATENIMNRVPKRLSEAFKPMLDAVMYASGETTAREAYEALRLTMERDAGKAVQCLSKDLDALLAHYRFAPQFWRALRTTNPIERVNKEFKRRYRSMGTIGERTLRSLLAFTALRLELGWASRPIDSKTFETLVHVRPNAIEKTLDTLGIAELG